MTTLTRIQKNTAGTLRHTFTLDEDPTDSPTAVTYAVVDAVGAAVASGTATLDAVASGTYSFVLPAQTALAALTVTWTGTIGGSATTQTTGAEIVGGHFFSLAQGRASDAALADPSDYTLAELTDARLETEWECEHICDLAMVPRYDRVVLDGSGTGELLLKHSQRDRSVAEVRTVRSVRMADSPDGTFTVFTVAEGGVFRLDMPGPFKTGVPTVDAAYARYSRRSTGTGATGRAVPASRTLTYTPQAGSMFHGWRRR